MDLTEVLLILGIFLPLFFAGIWQLNRLNPNKKAAKAGDSSIKELYNVYNNQVSDVLKLKDKAIASLQAKLRNFEEEEEIEEEQSIPLDDLKPLLQQQGINPAILEIPFVKDKIKEFTQGMSIQDVLKLVSQFKKTDQGTESKQSIEIEQNNPSYF